MQPQGQRQGMRFAEGTRRNEDVMDDDSSGSFMCGKTALEGGACLPSHEQFHQTVRCDVGNNIFRTFQTSSDDTFFEQKKVLTFVASNKSWVQ